MICYIILYYTILYYTRLDYIVLYYTMACTLNLQIRVRFSINVLGSFRLMESYGGPWKGFSEAKPRVVGCSFNNSSIVEKTQGNRLSD